MDRRNRKPGVLILLVMTAAVLLLFSGEAEAAKRELKKEDGKYHYYIDGVLQKNTWATYRGYRYYFKSNGDGAVGSYAVKGVYYIFSSRARLFRPEARTVVTVNKVHYLVKRGGKAASGWDPDHRWYFARTGKQVKSAWTSDGKYYLDKKGEKTTGIAVIAVEEDGFPVDTFFYFNSSTGKLNAARTEKLQSAAVYENLMNDLYKMIGKPLKAKYYGNGCYAGPNGDEPGGKDGVLTYKKFKVFTYRTKNKEREYFMGAESR